MKCFQKTKPHFELVVKPLIIKYYHIYSIYSGECEFLEISLKGQIKITWVII